VGLLAEGLSNVEIGRRLYISDHTVKYHLRRAYRKLGVANRTEAATLALRRLSSSSSLRPLAGAAGRAREGRAARWEQAGSRRRDALAVTIDARADGRGAARLAAVPSRGLS
jgi:hypothetical protein